MLNTISYDTIECDHLLIDYYYIQKNKRNVQLGIHAITENIIENRDV